MERYKLERGGILLGVVTRCPRDGHQGSWPDWGWLEAADGFAAAGILLAEECRLHDEAVRLDQQGGDPTGVVAEAAQRQAEFMSPGVVLVSLEDGSRSVLDELHVEGSRVFWR